MSPTRRSQEGGSLLEALVAMLVLAIGVLGMAALQVRTLTTARTTHLRAVAIQAIDDLQDRMQANTQVPLNPSSSPYLTELGKPPPADTDCSASPCNGTQLANFDLVQWKSALARTLPEGDARVFSSEGDPTQFGVLIVWKEAKARNESQAGKEEADLFTEAVAVRDASGQLGTGVAGKECPSLRTCHLVYLRP